MTRSPLLRVSGMLGLLASSFFLGSPPARAQAALQDFTLQPDGPHEVTAGFGMSAELPLTLGNGGSLPAEWKLVFEGRADTALGGVRESLDEGVPELLALIPDRYLFSEGATGSSISDGGNDMYDGGNHLLAGGTLLNYSDSGIAGRSIGSGSVSYFTRKYEGLFVMAADFAGVDTFAITGNLGADGSGQVSADEFSVSSGGVAYRAYVHRVHAAGDPSVNQLILVPSKAGLSRSHPTTTDTENHRVSGLGSSARVYYLLFAKPAGGFYATRVFQDLAKTFLETVEGGPSWASAVPPQGSTAAGGNTSLSIHLDGSDLAPGDYRTRFAVVPQEMAYEGIPAEAFRDLTFTINAPAFTIQGGDRILAALAGISPDPIDVLLEPSVSGTVLSDPEAASSAPWVVVENGSQPNSLRLSFDTGSLPAGTHHATVSVGAGGTLRSFAVSVVVAPLKIVRFLPDPARPRIYALNGNGLETGSLLVIDTLTRTIIRNIPLGRKPADCDIGDDGDTLFAINAVDQSIQEIDLETLQLTRTHVLADYSNWGQNETHAHVRAGKGDILYYVDGQWGPRLRVFNRATGQVLQTFGSDSTGTSNDDGIGGLAMMPDGSAIYTWKQYGWSAGVLGTYISKFRVKGDGTLAFESRTPDARSANFDRDPLDTPAMITSDGRNLVVKDRSFLTSDPDTVTTIYPDEVYSMTPGAEIAAGAREIYSGRGGEILHTLPVAATVQAITPDYRHLVYFNSTTASIVWLDLVATLGMDALGLVIEPADGSTVAQPERLSWLPITGVRRYQVYYGTDRAAVENGTPGSATYLGESPNTWFALPSVPGPGQTLYWRIVPIGEDGNPAGAGEVRSFFVSPVSLTRSSIDAETVEGVLRHQESISLSAADPVAWSATADVPWITFAKGSGTTPDDLEAVFDASALAPGFHTGNIIVSSGGTTFDVPVSLRVHPANFMIAESDLELPWVYAVSQESNASTKTSFLLRINTATDRIESAVPCGRSVTDLAIHYAENRIYLTNWQTGILRAFDRGTFRQVQTYQFSPAGDVGYSQGDIWRVAAGKQGRVIVEEYDQWISLRLIDTSNGAVLATAPGSHYAGDGESDPTGRYYYHADFTDGLRRYDLAGDSFAIVNPKYPSASGAVLMIGDGSKVASGSRLHAADTTLLFSLPAEIRAATLHGDLLFAGNKAYNGNTGLELATLPVAANVMSVTGDQEKLYLFPANSRNFRTVDLSAIAELPPREIIPSIADGSTVNGTSQSLSWTLEPFALSYRVYFGTDPEQVANATGSGPLYLGESSTNSWAGALPALELGGTYYWRVDTVGYSGTHRGETWSFRVAPLAVTPGKLEITMAVSSSAEARAFGIMGPSGKGWSASTATPWLSFANSDGGVPGILRLRIDPAGLTAGTRQGSVTIQSGADSWDIPVTLELLALNFTMAKADLELPYIYAISQAASGPDDRAFMAVVDTRSERIVRMVPAGRSVTDLSIHYQENRIYLSNWASGHLLGFDRTTFQEVRRHAYEPAGATGYSSGDVFKVAAGRSGRLIFEEQDQWIDFFLIDTATGNKLSTGHAREGGGIFDPAGRYYYHGENNSSGAALLKFDTAGDAIVHKASKRVSGYSYYGSRRVVASGDGSRIFWNGGVFDTGLNVLVQLSDEVVASTYRAEVIFTDDSAFNGVNGEKLATLPVATPVQGVSHDQRKLFLFKEGGFSVVDIGGIAEVPPRGLLPGIADASTVIGTDQELSWSQEAAALSYDVYFGSSEAEVAGADRNSPAYLGNVSGIRWTGALPPLSLGGSYWWRVDIVGFNSTAPGATWSFSVAPLDVLPRSLELACPAGSPLPRQEFTLSAGSPIPWTASTDTPWITLAAGSGTTPGSLQFDIDTTGMGTGLKEGSITLQAGGSSFSIPVDLRIVALNVTKLVSHPARPVVYGINTAAAGEGFSHLLEIDAATAGILRSIPIGFSPTDADLDPAAERLYVSNWGHSQTRVIDLAAWRELAPLPLGEDVYKLEITPRGRLVTEGKDQWVQLQLRDAAGGATISSIGSVREGDGQADPTGNFYYHSENNISNASVTKYDISADTFVAVAESAPGNGSRNLILSPDGSRLFWQSQVLDADLEVLAKMPGEVHATTSAGVLAIGTGQVWWADSGVSAADLPFGSTVAAVSANDAYLLRFNPASKALVSTPVSTITDLPGPWPRPGQVLDESPQRLSWSPVPGATAYRVFIARDAAGLAAMSAPLATVTTTWYELSEALDFGRFYVWRVDAVTPSGTLQGSLQSFGLGFPEGPALPGTFAASQGTAAAMSAGHLLLGIGGQVHLMDFDPETGAASPLQVMTLESSQYDTNFGGSLASDGSKAAVGAAGYDNPADGGGGVFFYRPSEAGYWGHEGVLVPTAPVTGEGFGTGLASAGNLMLAGTNGPYGTPGRVAAYVTEPDAFRTQTFGAADGEPYDGFGRLIAMQGNEAIIAAYGPGQSYNRSPALYAFARSTTTGLWMQTQKITIPGGVSYGNSGIALALSGKTLALKHPGTDSVLVYAKNASGQWIANATINRANVAGASSYYFGAGLALEGDMLFIGDSGANADGTGSGAVFTFRRSSASTWDAGPVILPGEAGYRNFGADLAVRDGWLLATGSGSRPAKLFRTNAAANKMPVFREGLPTQVVAGRPFSIPVRADDAEGQGHLDLDVIQGPAWLGLVPQGGGEALLEGTPAGNSGDVHVVQLRVRDVDGGETFHAYRLTVLSPDDVPVLTLEPGDAAAGEGQELVLRAAASGVGPLKWQWYRGGEAIPGATRPVLYFGEVSLEDSGSYSVRVSNAVGEDLSAAAEISVHEANRFAGDWPTFGGGARHTGYHPARLGRHTFVPAWTSSVAPGLVLNRAASGDGRVYVTPEVYFGGTVDAVALDLRNGTRAWTRTFAQAYSLNPPTFHNGSVYLQRGNHGGDTQLWALNAANGETLWSAPHSAQWERYEAPAVTDEGVWVNGGYYGGMYGFTPSGEQRFFRSLGQYDGWTPTVSEGRLFSWVEGIFREHQPFDGSVLWSVNTGWDWQGWTMGTVSAVSGDSAVVFNTTEIVCIDLPSRSIRWRRAGNFSGSPAVADGMAFGIRNRTVESFSLADGTPGPALELPEKLVSEQPLVLKDALAVAGESATYLLDRSGMTLLRTLEGGGLLSYAQGYLLAAGQDGVLRAWYANGAPVLSESFPAAVDAGAAAQPVVLPLAAHVEDIDPGDSLAWSLVSVSNPDLFSSISIGAADGSLLVAYDPWMEGSSVVVLAAVDEAGNRTEASITFTLPPHPEPELLVDSQITLNRQSGLYEQTVKVTNAGERAIAGFDLRVGGLPAGVTVMNEALAGNGVWTIRHRQPVPAGAAVTYVLKYYTPLRGTALDPRVEVDLHVPGAPPPRAAGAGAGPQEFAIDRFERLGDGAVVLGFPAEPGALYEVQYSHDMSEWHVAPTRLRAEGDRIEWTDRGAPETADHPSTRRARFYRAVKIEESGN